MYSESYDLQGVADDKTKFSLLEMSYHEKFWELSSHY